MVSKLFCSLFLAFAIALTPAFAQTKIELQANDTIQSILEKQIGQAVEFRMKSGEKISGKLEKINEKVAHLSSLTGAEYFDAIVAIDGIAAVVVRAKTK